METHLLFCQRRLHIGDSQRLGKQFRMIQFIDVLMIVHYPLHIAQLLIVGQRIHRFELDSYIPILHTPTIVALVTLIGFRIIRYHNLAIVLHILIRLLTGLTAVLPGISVIIIRHILTVTAGSYTVTLVELHLHNLKLILLRPLTITNLLSGFSAMIVTGHEIGIFIYHSGIIADSTAIIPRLCTQQTTIDRCHHIIRLYLQHKVKIFYRPVVITNLRTQQTAIIVSEEIIRINIQRQIVVTHGTSQIILMKTRQSTINVVA